MLRFYNSAHEDITNQPSQYCGSPACLGEPWCSAWGICKANLTMETPEEASFASEDDVYSPLFAALSQQLDSSSPTEPALPTFVECEPSHPISSSPPAKKRRLFAPIWTDKDVKEARASSVPKKTLEDTKYCLGLFQTWTEYRNSENGDNIGPIEELSMEELQHWLSRFVLEVSI